MAVGAAPHPVTVFQAPGAERRLGASRAVGHAVGAVGAVAAAAPGGAAVTQPHLPATFAPEGSTARAVRVLARPALQPAYAATFLAGEALRGCPLPRPEGGTGK